jgi:hypothetical protein
MSDLRRRVKTLEKPIIGRAKNVVFFLGDGMSLATVTAARVHMEQTSGKPFSDGNTSLTFENFPYTGLVRVGTTVMVHSTDIFRFRDDVYPTNILYFILINFICFFYPYRHIAWTNKWPIRLVRRLPT